MPNIILAVNSGSSSVKVTAYQIKSSSLKPSPIGSVQVSGLTNPPAKLRASGYAVKDTEKELQHVQSQDGAFKEILNFLSSPHGPEQLKEIGDVEYVAHRIVHGGDSESPRAVNEETVEYLEDLSDLAPLHNSNALEIVQAVGKQLPHAKNLVYFDTSFHQNLPEHIRTYPIDPKLATQNKLRKYGFHGISYQFIVNSVADHLDIQAENLNLIALHLGSGASACCIKNGVSYDTSMGLTPLSGLPGATRSGSVDPSLVFHYTHDAGKPSSLSTKDLHITTAEEILNKKSGWSAMTGTTDFGEIASRAEKGDKTAALAFEILVDRIVGYVASYYVKLHGNVDALVFAGGIGEKGSTLRRAVIKAVECLGFEIDGNSNNNPDDEVVVSISAQQSKHKILVCQTDEQFQMASSIIDWISKR